MKFGLLAVCALWSAVLAAANPTATVDVDAQQDRHPISAEVYGTNNADQTTLQTFHIPLHRLGGNRMSRYNWADNTDATASFYYFESYPGGVTNIPGGIADSFIQAARNAGAEPMMTVPMLDWITRKNPADYQTPLCSFNKLTYPGQVNDYDPFFPNCGTGVYPGGAFVVNDPSDAGAVSDSNTQSFFVQHLINTWGTQANGGLKYYVLDNEYSDWHNVHRDAHPVGAGYEEIKSKTLSFGEMIRAAEPNALILWSEEVGWYAFYFSGRDLRQYDIDQTTPDYTSHGNTFAMDWLLDQIFQHDEANPTRRVLDVFSMHWYPSGNEFSNDTSQATELLRNRSTRALWDPNYADENGLVDPASGLPAQPDFIHRMQNEVSTHYPGLKTALTEYSWGPKDVDPTNDMNFATAQADVLGILGREGLDIGTAWFDHGMDPTEPAAKAFAIYRNYDGAASTFGETNVRATTANPDNVAAFAAQRNSDGVLTIVVINKYLTQTADITVNLANFPNTGSAQVWQLASNAITHPANIPIAASAFTASVPAKSVTLFAVAPLALNPDFTISCSHSTVLANPGTNGAASCTLTSQQGFNSALTLSCTGLPAGAGPCSFATNPVTPTATVGLTLPAGPGLAPGNYPFQARATNGVTTHTFNMSLHVAVGAPKRVPNGEGGTTAAKWTKGNAAATNTTITWDNLSCVPSGAQNYNVIYGWGSGLSAYTLAGSACNIGTTGTFNWTTTPAIPGGENLLWWVIVETDGLNQEGSWGTNSSNVERKGITASAQCGAATRVNNTCP